MRFDHRIIMDLVKPSCRVLDLGCGDGQLLEYLKNEKSAQVTGIEINEKAIYKCIEKGLTVSHGNIDSGLSDYSNNRFDYVILNESLQEVLYLENVILEALRVGRQVIVGIPNFCHWRARLQVFFQGRVPITKELPYPWYETPNLRFLSIKDFEKFCKIKKIKVKRVIVIAGRKIIRFLPNLFGRTGIFLLSKNH